MAVRTVADAVADALLDAGPVRVFADASARSQLMAAARRRGLDVLEVASPAVAAVMAAVAGELSEGPGVLVLGARAWLEAVPGLAYAVSSGAPLVVVSEDPVELPLRVSMKASLALDPESAGSTAAGAAWLARSEPRGPVHMTLEPAMAERPAAAGATMARPAPPPAPDPAALDEAAERLARADRPVLVAGSQCRSGLAPRWIRALAETMPAPVFLAARARGVLPDPHPLVLGDVGALAALGGRADLVVAIGVDETTLSSLPAATPILHLAATPPPAGWTPAARVLGDVGLIMEELAPRLRGRSRADWDVAELDRLKRVREARTAAVMAPAERVVAVVREVTPAGTIATADGAAGAAVTAAWQAVGPNELLVAAPGPPAFAAAAAIAARLALPGRHAVAFTDAPGLAASGGALEEAVRLGVAVVVVVLGEAASAPDPMALARRHGVAGTSAPTAETLARAVPRALAAGAPWVIDARAGRGPGSPV